MGENGKLPDGCFVLLCPWWKMLIFTLLFCLECDFFYSESVTFVLLFIFFACEQTKPQKIVLITQSFEVLSGCIYNTHLPFKCLFGRSALTVFVLAGTELITLSFSHLSVSISIRLSPSKTKQNKISDMEVRGKNDVFLLCFHNASLIATTTPCVSDGDTSFHNIGTTYIKFCLD